MTWSNFDSELIFQEIDFFTLGHVKVRNTRTQGPEHEDTIPITLILVKLDRESPKATTISMKKTM